jgi:hypothetical protein
MNNEQRKEMCLEMAAQAWCDKRTEHLTMIPELAEVFSEMLLHEMYEPSLGCATTEMLLDEIKARVNLNYRTIDEK